MDKNYSVKDILSAIDNLLGSKEEKPLRLIDQIEKPLMLKKEIKIPKKKSDKIPKNTEKIILQAEKYLKK